MDTIPYTPKLDAAPMTLETLAAKIDACSVQAGEAKAAAMRSEALSIDIKKTVTSIATDHLFIRRGFPASWTARLSFIGAAALFGALSALSVLSCVRH